MSRLLTKTHKLKLMEEFADDVCMGYKSFEVRVNDRDFQKGDTVQFVCVTKTGIQVEHAINSKVYEITYILSGWGIKEGYVVFGIREVQAMSDEKLKPCPFCGGEAAFIGDTRSIKCKCCGGAFICTNPLITALEVKAAWNTRKPMERIVEQLEERKNHADNMLLEFKGTMTGQRCEVRSETYKKAIEIVKGDEVDEAD